MVSTIQGSVAVNGQNFPFQYPDLPGSRRIMEIVFFQKEYPYLPCLAQDARVILDVGANIGCATVWFRALYPGALILACEPARDSFEHLKANAAALANVRVFPFGLYDRDCVKKLYHGRRSHLTNSIAHSCPGNSEEYEEVRLRRASSFLAEQGVDRITLVKINSEGSELPVLRDLERLLPRIDAVAVEYHSDSDRVAIDRLLSPRFALVHGKVHILHRGGMVYVAKEIVAARTKLNQLAIVRAEG